MQEEKAFHFFGPAGARAAIADRNGGILPRIADYKKTEPYLGTVDRRGHEVDAFLDPDDRLDEFDEFGVPIRDPVEARNRRRNREHPSSPSNASLYDAHTSHML